jgi:hypothetical protein
MSWNVSRSLSPHLRGFVASVDDHDGFGDFVCEVLEDAYQRGFVSEAAKILRADAYLIGGGLLFPSASVSRWHRTDRNWLFTQRSRSVLKCVREERTPHCAIALSQAAATRMPIRPTR